MGENSAIEWCDHTFNPWIGCTRVSPGCQHCYAEGWAKRSGLVGWGPKEPRRLTSLANWAKPKKWNAEAGRTDIRPKVFVASLADVFDDHNSIDAGWRNALWRLIFETPNLDWLALTKRPENWPLMLPVSQPDDGAFSNLRLGVTIEDQDRFDERGPHLQMIADIGWPTFVSYEPALGPVDWSPALKPHAPAIGSLFAGGESGPGARQSHPDWFRQARDQMAAAGVPFLFKQWGDWAPDDGIDADGRDPIVEGRARCATWDGQRWMEWESGHHPPPDAGIGEWVYRLGKKRAGRLLDGVQHDGMPGRG